MGMLELFFGKKKKCRGRKTTKGRRVRKVSARARVMIGGKKRKVYKGCNGGLYYKRTKNGKTYRVYVSPKLLRKKSSTRFGRRGVKKGSRLKMTKSAVRARAYARKRRRCLKKGKILRRNRCRLIGPRRRRA